MKPTTHELLTDDILLSIFDRINLLHRKRLARVCRRWKELIDITFLWVTVFSAVDARRCVCDWQPSNWLSLKSISQVDYIRIPKVSASEILAKMAPKLPNLVAIDLECCDMSNRIIRNILSCCKKVERINLDSSTRLNFYSFNLMIQDWNRLRHVNLSCCTEVNEVSARFLIVNLPHLESLNLCGTRINGQCLNNLNAKMRRLDISYCWAVQEDGLAALAKAPCTDLIELSVNNFDFDRSENCLIDLCTNFPNLKHLQMSIGPCVAHDYFIDRLSVRGFSAISKLKNLETLVIEKICIMDDVALVSILKGCPNLKCLRLNLGWLNHCTDVSFMSLGVLVPHLEELQISYPSTLSTFGMISLNNLRNLKSLSLINTNIDNDIFKLIESHANLNKINFDECRKVTLRGLNHLCRIANKKPGTIYRASLLGTGINISRLKNKRNFPPNLFAEVSNFRANKFHMMLPPPPVAVQSLTE